MENEKWKIFLFCLPPAARFPASCLLLTASRFSVLASLRSNNLRIKNCAHAL